MGQKELAIKKLYYSISEVSRMTSIKPYVLRYWETEFRELRPSKNRSGKRIYRASDIELVVHIKKLLYEDKFTIDGARQQLGKSSNRHASAPSENIRKNELIGELKQDLHDFLKLVRS